MFPHLPTSEWRGLVSQAEQETSLLSWGTLLRAGGCWCCAGAQKKISRVCGGACLGMLRNINLRGRYLLKFQLRREMSEAELGLAFTAERGEFFYLGVMFLTYPKVKSDGAKELQRSARQRRQGQEPDWGMLLEEPTSPQQQQLQQSKKNPRERKRQALTSVWKFKA